MQRTAQIPQRHAPHSIATLRKRLALELRPWLLTWLPELPQSRSPRKPLSPQPRYRTGRIDDAALLVVGSGHRQFLTHAYRRRVIAAPWERVPNLPLFLARPRRVVIEPPPLPSESALTAGETISTKPRR